MSLSDQTRGYIKQKLTLALNKDVIQRAKDAGINISAITEQLLSALTFEPVGNTKSDLVTVYEKFFTSIQTVLDKYNATVRVGKGYSYFTTSDKKVETEVYDIYLDNKILYIWADYFEEPVLIEVKNEIENMFSPTEILENLVNSVISGAERNTDTIQEMKFALRFLKTLSNHEDQNNAVDGSNLLS